MSFGNARLMSYPPAIGLARTRGAGTGLARGRLLGSGVRVCSFLFLRLTDRSALGGGGSSLSFGNGLTGGGSVRASRSTAQPTTVARNAIATTVRIEPRASR